MTNKNRTLKDLIKDPRINIKDIEKSKFYIDRIGPQYSLQFSTRSKIMAFEKSNIGIYYNGKEVIVPDERKKEMLNNFNIRTEFYPLS